MCPDSRKTTIHISDLAISLEVIFHLIEDDVFEKYMHQLFNASNKFVIIYNSNNNSSNYKPPSANSHAFSIRHRKITDYIENHFPEWQLVTFIKNTFPYHSKHKVKGKTSFSNF